ncbi:MAG: hypothetical protein R2883_02160 [Caldisericia bacterium]
MMNRKVFILLLAFIFVVPTNFIYSKDSSVKKIIPSISTGMVIVPDTNLERLYLSAASDTWIKDGARRSNDFVEYELQIFENLPVVLELDAAGPYIIDISMGGAEFTSVYSSGQLDGDLSGRMKRQIAIDIQPENPMRLRVKRRESASEPFTLWRLNIYRMHEIFPGSETESNFLVKTGESTLPSGGGRLIPANTEISYSVSHAANKWVTFFVEVDKPITAKVDDTDLVLKEHDGKYWISKKIVEGDNVFSVSVTEETKLRSFTMFYDFAPVDTKSDLGNAFTEGETGEYGLMLSDKPVRVFVPGDHNYFCCFSTAPESLSVFGLEKKILCGVAFFDITDSSNFLNITGEGELLSFTFDDDNDEDGIPTCLELVSGTDPYLFRTDNDDLNDGLDDRPLDTDNDGLNDNVESFLMLSTKYADTDSDGHYDGLGLEGFERNNFCARVTDSPWIGAEYIDSENREIITECQKFGKTSMVIPFHDVLVGFKPSDVIVDMFDAVGDCDGFLLDTCAISAGDFDNHPELVDEYQIWGKRLWTNLESDDGLAFTLHNFVSDRIKSTLAIARAYTNRLKIELAVTIPSPSEFSEWMVPYDGLMM